MCIAIEVAKITRRHRKHKMKIVGNFEIKKSYEHWKSVFDAHESQRSKAGIETIFVGRELDNSQKIHVLFEVESVQAMQEFMQSPENAPVIEEAGHLVETTVMIPISD